MTRRVAFACTLTVVALAALASSGCATILKGGSAKGQVQFRNTPELPGDQALQIWVDGQPRRWALQFSKAQGDKVISEPTINLSTKSGHEVRVRVGGCEAEFRVQPSISGWWIVLDVFVGLGVGVLVDWYTGAWAEFGSAAILSTPQLMETRGRPVPGMSPVLPCGTRAGS